jgi:hypothetical protein
VVSLRRLGLLQLVRCVVSLAVGWLAAFAVEGRGKMCPRFTFARVSHMTS